MNLSPNPHRNDVVFVDDHVVNITTPGVRYEMSISSATFQGNDRPALTAYGDTPSAAVASLYNALTVEYELDREGQDDAL